MDDKKVGTKVEKKEVEVVANQIIRGTRKLEISKSCGIKIVC